MKQLVVNSQIHIPLEEFELRFDRSGGPGGQNVNKVASKVTLRWPVKSSPSLSHAVRQRFLERYRRRITKTGDLVMSSQKYRDQGRNIEDCYEKIRQLLLDVATPPKKRKATKPTHGSRERRLREKRARTDSIQRRKPPRMDD
ncbi:MAG: aminoacyl-tRNA hydrolase [Pirellulaceae bacterium]|nr:aminoacyl-tRNA hydrolase [Pirellulaceae bacterium]